MADFWLATVKLAGETARALKRGNKRTTKFEGKDNGKSVVVNGWRLHYFNSWSDERWYGRPGSGDFEEWWGHRELILGTDGKIYDYSENTTEYGSARPGGARKVIENKLQFARKGTLLGLGRGKPFAVLQEELERLPYKL